MFRILFAFIAILTSFAPASLQAQPSPLPVAVPSSAPSTAPTAPPTALEYDRTEDTTIYFKAPPGTPVPPPLKTELYDLVYLGVLRPSPSTPPAQPYFLFTGRPCKNCIQDVGVYAIRPTGGRPTTYVHPGKILDSKTGAVVLESRAFFGRCLTRQSGTQYLVFQKERVDRRNRLQISVLIAEPGSDHMNERLIERHLPRLEETLRLVKSKACHEITGRNRRMLSRPLDINTRHQIPEKDEDDAESKEDSTDL